MISAAVIWVLYILVYAITLPIRALPDVSLPADIATSLASARDSVAGLNVVLPLTTIAGILALVITIETAFLSYKIIMWIIRRLPTQN